jgi:hypothetical protein
VTTEYPDAATRAGDNLPVSVRWGARERVGDKMARTTRNATIVAMATGAAMMLTACGGAAPTGAVQSPAPAPVKQTGTVLERATDSCKIAAPDLVEDGHALFLISPEGERVNPDLDCVLTALDIPQSIVAEMKATGDGENGTDTWAGITAHWSYDAQLGLDVALTVE